MRADTGDWIFFHRMLIDYDTLFCTQPIMCTFVMKQTMYRYKFGWWYIYYHIKQQQLQQVCVLAYTHTSFLCSFSYLRSSSGTTFPSWMTYRKIDAFVISPFDCWYWTYKMYVRNFLSSVVEEQLFNRHTRKGSS